MTGVAFSKTVKLLKQLEEIFKPEVLCYRSFKKVGVYQLFY